MAETTDEEKDLDEKDLEAEPEEEAEKSDDKDDEVVPVRRSTMNAQRRIIETQGKKLAEKTSKTDDEEGEVNPQTRKLIESAVTRAVAPLQDELAFRDYFSQHPEDRKLEKQARARFDAWGNVPIEEVMKTLRTSVDPQERTKAEEKAQRNSMKGGSARPREEAVASTEKDFQEIYRNVKRGNTGEALKKLGVK